MRKIKWFRIRNIFRWIRVIKNFKALYPKYDGLIIADGGIQKNHLNSLEDIGVDIAVQGGAIFGWPFTLFRVSK